MREFPEEEGGSPGIHLRDNFYRDSWAYGKCAGCLWTSCVPTEEVSYNSTGDKEAVVDGVSDGVLNRADRVSCLESYWATNGYLHPRNTIFF